MAFSPNIDGAYVRALISARKKIKQLLADKGITPLLIRLSLNDARAQQIQPGTYRLRQQMSAEAALTALLDPSARVQAKFTIPEGARVGHQGDGMCRVFVTSPYTSRLFLPSQLYVSFL